MATTTREKIIQLGDDLLRSKALMLLVTPIFLSHYKLKMPPFIIIFLRNRIWHLQLLSGIRISLTASAKKWPQKNLKIG